YKVRIPFFWLKDTIFGTSARLLYMANNPEIYTFNSQIMSTKYTVTGMSCNGCRSKVETTLNQIQGVTAHVTLNPPEAHMQMPPGTTTQSLQNAWPNAGDYTISDGHEPVSRCGHPPQSRGSPLPAIAVFYCPLPCEGDNTFQQPRDSPVCGMHLVPTATN